MKNAKELGLNIQYLGTISFDSPQTYKIAGEAAEGAIFTAPLFMKDSNNEKMQTYWERYREIYNKDPNVMSSIYYDGLGMIYDAISESENPRDNFNYIVNNKYNGVLGSLAFTNNGDMILPIAFKTIKSGEIVYYNSTG